MAGLPHQCLLNRAALDDPFTLLALRPALSHSQRFLRHALMKLPMLLLLASSSPRYGDIMQATVAGQAGERGSLACCFGSSLVCAAPVRSPPAPS